MDNPAPPSTDRPPSGEGPQEPVQGPRVTRNEVKDLGRLRRSVTDRHVGGVAGGLARHLDVDPILVRVALVVAVFLGGAGLLIYGAAWVLVPEEGTADQPLGLDERSRAGALLVVGVLAVLAAVGDWVDAYWFPWPVAVIALGVLWLVNRNRSGAPAYGSTPTYSGAPGYTGSAPPYDGTVPPGYDSTGYDSTGYDSTGYDSTVAPYGSPAPYDGTVPPGYAASYAKPARPRNPRKRGPILFWFTLALIALAEGLLGVVHAAGTDVVPSAYPALALGITAAMLLLGSFWGRAGGLVLIGLLAAVGTAVTATADSWNEQSLLITPLEAGDVSSSYELDKGELLLDLSEIDAVEGLDGRDIRIDGGVGRIEVIVPDGVDIRVTTDVGVGDAAIFDRRADGLGVTHEGSLDGGTDAPDLDITIDLGVGEVVVREN